MGRNTITTNVGFTEIITDLTDRIIALERTQQFSHAKVTTPDDPDLAFLWITGGEKLAPFDVGGWAPKHALTNSQFAPVTSATFVPCFEAAIALLYTPELEFSFPIGVDAATTGEVKITFAGQATDTESLSASFSGNANCRWAHGADIGTGPGFVKIEARRLTGTGNINIWWPTTCSHRGNTTLVTGGLEVV